MYVENITHNFPKKKKKPKNRSQNYNNLNKYNKCSFHSNIRLSLCFANVICVKTLLK